MHHITPVFEMDNVAYKMDCYQPSGSFKLRGLGRLMHLANQNGSNHFVSSSGGNAGLTAAFLANKLNSEIEVVLPVSTDHHMIRKIEAYGATIHVHGNHWAEADEYARKIVENKGAFYVHPFDHNIIWEGHSTIITESMKVINEPEEIYVSVGGGGLLMGVLLGLEAAQWNTKVFAVETFGANAFHQALEAGKPVTLEKISSVARSLGANRIPNDIFLKAQQHEVESILVSDKEAIQGCVRALDLFGSLVDPACGSVVSAVSKSEKKRLAIMCGGRLMSHEKYVEYLGAFDIC
ncbi:MAG: pyridoxal-phosphate dependent enzyme [Flavobacteriales bacterium]|nr:pyridoxal-phosphate dependent enzyme [Flavobacteriales bacterium]